MPTIVDKETGAIREAPGRGPELDGQDAIDYDRRQREQRLAKQEREDRELEELRAPWVAECDRLKAALQNALHEVRCCAFEVDCSSRRAARKSRERQVDLTAALQVANSVERDLHAVEAQGPPA
jgi:hypothetical protein